MTRTPHSTLTTGGKVFVGVAVVLTLLNIANFAFYGMRWHNLAAAVGFALMAYGTWRGGGPSPRAAGGVPDIDRRARLLVIAGLVLALVGMVARHFGQV